MDMRVAAYAVVERRGQILLTHWRRGHLHGWTLPGGGLEAGEDPRDAVVREVFEETGLEAKVGKLLGVDSRVMVREEVPEGSDPELHTIRIVYRATVKDAPLRNEIGGSSDEARWVPLREVRSLRTLSLVQTGMRMAGIGRKPQQRQSSKAGGRGAKAQQAAKGQGSKQSASKSSSAKPATSKQSSTKQSAQKQAGARSGAKQRSQSGRVRKSGDSKQ